MSAERSGLDAEQLRTIEQALDVATQKMSDLAVPVTDQDGRLLTSLERAEWFVEAIRDVPPDSVV